MYTLLATVRHLNSMQPHAVLGDSQAEACVIGSLSMLVCVQLCMLQLLQALYIEQSMFICFISNRLCVGH